MNHEHAAQPGKREFDWLAPGVLVVLFVFGWHSIRVGRFNALDTPLLLAVGTFCLWLLAGAPVTVARSLLRAYLFWAGWIVFCDVYSAKFVFAFARDSHWLLLPLFALLCGTVLRAVPRAIALLRLAAAASLLYIALYLAVAAPGTMTGLREPVFGHIRYLSMAVGILVIWLYDDAPFGPAARLTLFAGRLAGLTLLFWAGGRGVLLALGVALVVHMLLLSPGRIRALRYALEIVAAAFVAALLGVDNPLMGPASVVSRTIAPTAADGMFYGRIAIWHDTWQRLAAGFGLWFGWGGNGYIRMGLAQGYIFHPHNVILQVLTDWGIIGLALSVNLLRAASQSLAGAQLRTPSGALAIAILVFLSITGSLDGGLYHPQFLLCAGLAFGMLASQTEKEPVDPVTLRLPPLGLVVSTLAIHLVMLF